MLRSVKRSHRKELSFCAKQSEVAESNCHSAWSETESQNLLENHRIDILGGVKRNRRIYCRTDEGFCNSGQKRPPCRMKRWMDENELKDLRFCLIHQLPKKNQIFLRTLFADSVILPETKRGHRIELSFCAKRSVVAESLLYQNITTIPLNCAPLSSIFEPDF